MLSAEQQNIIENSIWVVNTALKRQNLTHNEDLRQSAIVYMCKCLLRYDSNTNVKWTTFAYKNVYLYIKRTNKKQNLKQRLEIVDDCACEKDINDEEYSNDNLVVKDIFNLCTQREQQLLKLRMNGYKNYEIGKILNCSLSNINRCMRNIKNKIVKNELEGENENAIKKRF